MGGAVALLTHKKDPRFWDGAVLVAPMCKVIHNVFHVPIETSLLPLTTVNFKDWFDVLTCTRINK